MHNVATLEEIRDYYDLVDVLDAHEILDMKEDLDFLEAQRIERESKTRR